MLLKIGSVSQMSGKIQEWSVLIVEKFGYPRSADGSKELIVSSNSVSGAAMKANNIIKKQHEGWKIRSIWWLDPNRLKRER